MESSAVTVGEAVERAVLALLLACGDAEELSEEAVIAEIGDRARALRALERLRAVGLLEWVDGCARPTAAARRFDELNI